MIESQTVSLDAKAEDKRNILLVFAGLMVTMLLASLDQMIFSTALPTIVGELHGVNHMLWVTTTYILASTIMLPIYGKLGDLVGRKGLFIGAIALFIVGSIIGGLAPDMSWLIGGRAVQGLGGGGLMILAQAIIADVIPARERGRYMVHHGWSIRPVIGRRPAAWRVVHRGHWLAVGVLDERSARDSRDRLCDAVPPLAEGSAQQGPSRRRGDGSSRHRLNRSGAYHHVGRHDIRLGFR